MVDYKVIKEIPSIEDYIKIRNATLGERKRSSVEKGLMNSWCGVYIVDNNNEAIAMGRMIGDGGLTFTVTDIAVVPSWQGRGLGRVIMEELMDYYKKNAPQDAYLSLMAVKDARYLYEKFGFVNTGESDLGMKYNPVKD